MESDSHTNTVCGGKGTRRIGYVQKVVTMHPHDYQPGTKVPVASITTLYEGPQLGHCYILFFNQALDFGNKIKTSLLNLNQLRDHGMQVGNFSQVF